MNNRRIARIRRLSAILLAWVCTGSVAIGAGSTEQVLKLNCLLNNEDGEQVSVNVSAEAEGEVHFQVNQLKLEAVFVPNLVSHPPNITFATSFGNAVYTLVMHRDYFLPHPDGYGPSKPPASLTVQSSDAGVTPMVDVFVGACVVE
ncbi:hypothetical protein [Ruegeria sp. MALMAid1280]|uniref:hypothetical protein n=1 Tax=Ruegeria sp. MALMAid1280 TaxID=3411634 RepID=UPI003B9F76CB